jgi:predicted DNA-binding protein (UPF0278 family)
MDFKDIAVMAGSVVLSIGVVSAFVAKVLPKITKYIRIAKEALDVADAAVQALQDNTITKEEIEVLLSEVQALKVALKA